MIVTVVAVGMMEMAVNQIVDVVTVGHRFVSAAGTVAMAGLMPGAGVIRRAAIGVAIADLQHVLVNVIAVRMVKVSVVKVINVIAVANGGMSAVGAVHVIVIVVVLVIAGGHIFTLVLR